MHGSPSSVTAELGHDAQTEELIAVGIGDMSRRSVTVCLAPRQPAWSQHSTTGDIFLTEPQRGSVLRRAPSAARTTRPCSSWQDYNRDLISAGGVLAAWKPIEITLE